MARPKKREPQTELEKLQAENLRLRAENALLKKVKALVEEEQKARARLNGQKPSTN
jgi:cell division protein FtsB